MLTWRWVSVGQIRRGFEFVEWSRLPGLLEQDSQVRLQLFFLSVTIWTQELAIRKVDRHDTCSTPASHCLAKFLRNSLKRQNKTARQNGTGSKCRADGYKTIEITKVHSKCFSTMFQAFQKMFAEKILQSRGWFNTKFCGLWKMRDLLYSILNRDS